jgi:hypothetical protein
MNFGQLKTKVIRLMNRTDMTDDLAAEFIGQAQVRIERTLRTTAMEKIVWFNPTDGAFRLPTDFLELSDLWYDDVEMERVDTSRWIKYPDTTGTPRVFIQSGHHIRMKPLPQDTDTLWMRYYASQPELTTDVDDNLWTLSAVDALTYGACEYACEYFEDERVDRFGSRFQTAMTELFDQSAQEDFAGPMSIKPAYSYQDEIY